MLIYSWIKFCVAMSQLLMDMGLRGGHFSWCIPDKEWEERMVLKKIPVPASLNDPTNYGLSRECSNKHPFFLQKQCPLNKNYLSQEKVKNYSESPEKITVLKKNKL